MKQILIVGLVVACAFGTRAAESLITTDQTAAGDWEVTVGADDTVVVTVSQTGTGKIVKKGAGKLRLTVASTFTGGTVIDEGVVEIAATDALGKGKITANADGSKTCQLAFVRNGTTTDNDFEVVGTSSVTQPVVYFNSGTNVWNGSISCSQGDIYFCDNGDWAYIATGGKYDPVAKTFSGGSWSTKVRQLPFMTFNGTVSVPNGTIYLVPDGTFTFNEKITCKLFDNMMSKSMFTLHTVGDASFYGIVNFNHANEIGELRMGYRTNALTVDDALNGTVINWGWYDTDAKRESCNLNHGAGVVSHAAAITGNAMTKNRLSCSIGGGTSAKHAKLFISGLGFEGQEAVSNARVNEYVDVIVDGTDHPGFTQTFSLRNHFTRGSLAVTNATLRLTNNTTFSNVTAIAVGPGGRFELASGTRYPFTGALKELNLCSGGTLVSMDACELTVSTLSVDGVPYFPGVYTAAQLPTGVLSESMTLTVTSMPAPSTIAVWTGASETPGNGMDDCANWKVGGTMPSELDFVHGTTAIEIGDDGDEMVYSGAKVVNGVKVTRNKNLKPFTIAPADEASELFIGGRMELKQVGQVVLKGRISSPNHIIGGEIETADDGNLIYLDVAMADTNTVDSTVYYKPAAQSGYYIPLVLDGVVVEKNIWSAKGNTGASIIYCRSNTTNVIKGHFCHNIGWPYFSVEKGATLTFEGGVYFPEYLARKRLSGTMIVKDKPYVSAKSYFMIEGGLFVMDAEGFSFKGTSSGEGMMMTGGNLECRRSWCFKGDSAFIWQSSYAGTADFNCTTQLITHLSVLPTSKSATMSGVYPAMLEVTGAIRDGMNTKFSGAALKCQAQVTGGLGFHFKPAEADAGKTFTLAGKAFASCGDLEVSGGTLELAADATWLNGTNLTVRGSGKLKTNANRTFGKHAVLRLLDAGSTVELPEAAVQRVAECWVGDTKVETGIYSAADLKEGDALYGHLTSGTLRVGKVGVTLLVR